jgi:hypothetical protein
VSRPSVFSVDPVIEAFKKDVDRTLLTESLKRTPEERLAAMVRMMELVEEGRRGLEKARK